MRDILVIVGAMSLATLALFALFEFGGEYATPTESLGYAAASALCIGITSFVLVILRGEK